MWGDPRSGARGGGQGCMNTESPAPEPQGLGGWEALSWSPRANSPPHGRRQSLRPPSRKGQKEPREAATGPRSHSSPASGSQPPRKACRGRNSVPQASPLPCAPHPSCHSRARMKRVFWPEREISRPGRAEAGDKRIRPGWKVTWLWSGFVGGGGGWGAVGRRGGGVGPPGQKARQAAGTARAEGWWRGPQGVGQAGHEARP